MASFVQNRVDFIESVTFVTLGQETKNYLEKKREHFEKQNNAIDSENGFGWYCAFQGAYLLKLPFKVIALAVQTVIDVAWVAFSALTVGLTLGLDPDCRDSLKLRTYNLLFADSITWLALPASLLYSPAFDGANALHLGTTRLIDGPAILPAYSANPSAPPQYRS